VQGGQDEVACQRCLDGDGSGLLVADLAQHDDVRVLTQEAFQCPGKGQPGLVVRLHLDDAPHVVFDGVLDGQHLAVGLVQDVQGGVEGGGLTRAGRSGDQDDSVGSGVQLAPQGQVLLEETQLAQFDLGVAPVQDTHDDALAHDRGQGGDAQVKVPAAHRELDAPVLGNPLLVDAQLGHDLDAGYDCR